MAVKGLFMKTGDRGAVLHRQKLVSRTTPAQRRAVQISVDVKRE